MSTRVDHERLLTPSKITAWLDCAHYLTLRRLADAHDLRPTNGGLGSFARLLMDKGLAHERAYLDQLRAEGLTVLEVPGKTQGESFERWASRVSGVLAEGHDVVYQLPMVHDGLRGVADFLVKVEAPSALGAFSYEPIDAKLARAQAKPGHVLQLCFYADALEAMQGRRPDQVDLYLGSGVRESIRLGDVEAYWRRIRHQLARVIADDGNGSTVPVLCSHCEFCEFAERCDSEWRAADALQYVAGIRRADTDPLQAAGVATMAALADTVDDIDGVKHERLAVIRHQAALQRHAVEGEPPPFEPILEPSLDEEALRRRQLPAPDDGDVFIDFEGHPFWTPARGLFFLTGLLYREAGEWTYEQRWAHDDTEEGEQTASLIAWIAERRDRYPSMHVYHYNHTERVELQRLARDHGADETLLSRLIDRDVFVDILDVVRQAVRVGAENYSLKTLELVAGYQRSHEIDKGAGAVVEYDEWMGDRDPLRLERIARYNADDVLATLAVRNWLLAEPLADEPFRSELEPTERRDVDVDELVAGLVATGEDWKVLLAHLLAYWNREGRAHWAQHAPLLQADAVDQLAHPEVIGGLEFAGTVAATGRQKHDRARFRFPPQEIGPEITARSKPKLMYPAGDSIISIAADSIDVDAGELVVPWNERAVEAPMPSAVVLNDWVTPHPKPAALAEFAQRVLDGDEMPSDGVRAAVLRRERPVLTADGSVGEVFVAEMERIVDAAVRLDHSYLAIQGPPGTGKTHTGARIIDRLVDRGLRVGVTAFSHAAIDNLIRKTLEARPGLRVLRQGSAKDGSTALPGATYDADRTKWDTGNHDLVGGTSWLFSRPSMAGALDVLVIDEAGQLGLADALAAMSSARNVILLGDPLQLAQVTLASHPGGAGASVLEHVLGMEATIPANRGVFLDTTWRMHPAICSFVSSQVYENRLHSHSHCERQTIGGVAGLRWIRAEHGGCETSSRVEADIVAAVIQGLLSKPWIDFDGNTHTLTAADVVVVAPYNDHVNLVRSVLGADPRLANARVGTVDKFQGQEAPVVIFTMATSSGDCMPRGAGFLYSRNRLNVAISRARSLAYVVCTEELLNTRARSVDEMRLIGTLCAFVEAAEPA